MAVDIPYALACDKNKNPILQVLRQQFTRPGLVLEIGSGTGQHAVHFAQHLPHLQWQPTDRAECLLGIQAWCESVNLPNLKSPRELDVTQSEWDSEQADYIFSANAVHIMPWEAVKNFFSIVKQSLNSTGMLGLYGPFNYREHYTSASNACFDSWLKQRDPLSGIRNFEDLDQLANSAGLNLVTDYEMPANNRTLIWARPSFRD